MSLLNMKSITCFHSGFPYSLILWQAFILKQTVYRKKNPTKTNKFGLGSFFGGAKGSRTPDLLNAIQTRYQLRYNPITMGLYNIFAELSIQNLNFRKKLHGKGTLK